jgi:hypothetical protein
LYECGSFCRRAEIDEKAIAYRVEFAMAKVNGVPMRPEELFGTSRRVGRGSVAIEDKRNRTKAKKQKAEEQDEIALDIAVEEDERTRLEFHGGRKCPIILPVGRNNVRRNI